MEGVAEGGGQGRVAGERRIGKERHGDERRPEQGRASATDGGGHGGFCTAVGGRLGRGYPISSRLVTGECPGKGGRVARGRSCTRGGDAGRGVQGRAAEDDGHGKSGGGRRPWVGGGRRRAARGGGGPGARGGAREWERRELCWSLREQMRETGLNPNFLCTCSLKLRGF
jgi:hypothetical protein